MVFGLDVAGGHGKTAWKRRFGWSEASDELDVVGKCKWLPPIAFPMRRSAFLLCGDRMIVRRSGRHPSVTRVLAVPRQWPCTVAKCLVLRSFDVRRHAPRVFGAVRRIAIQGLQARHAEAAIGVSQPWRSSLDRAARARFQIRGLTSRPHDQAVSSARLRRDHSPLHKSARSMAISRAPSSLQRIPCCLSRAPVTWKLALSTIPLVIRRPRAVYAG